MQPATTSTKRSTPPLRTEAIADWPFPVPVDTVGYCTRKVALQDYPILHVLHDWNGDWCFYDGTELPLQPLLPCLATVTDATLAQLADLPVGWSAWRMAADAPWHWEREGFGDDMATIGG